MTVPASLSKSQSISYRQVHPQPLPAEDEAEQVAMHVQQEFLRAAQTDGGDAALARALIETLKEHCPHGYVRYYAFTHEHKGLSTPLAKLGWQKVRSSWKTEADAFRYDEFRNRLVSETWLLVFGALGVMGYADAGTVEEFGTQSPYSDIDCTFVPHADLPEPLVHMARLLFDAAILDTYERPARELIETEIYLPHAARECRTEEVLCTPEGRAAYAALELDAAHRQMLDQLGGTESELWLEYRTLLLEGIDNSEVADMLRTSLKNAEDSENAALTTGTSFIALAKQIQSTRHHLRLARESLSASNRGGAHSPRKTQRWQEAVTLDRLLINLAELYYKRTETCASAFYSQGAFNVVCDKAGGQRHLRKLSMAWDCARKRRRSNSVAQEAEPPPVNGVRKSFGSLLEFLGGNRKRDRAQKRNATPSLALPAPQSAPLSLLLSPRQRQPLTAQDYLSATLEQLAFFLGCRRHSGSKDPVHCAIVNAKSGERASRALSALLELCPEGQDSHIDSLRKPVQQLCQYFGRLELVKRGRALPLDVAETLLTEELQRQLEGPDRAGVAETIKQRFQQWRTEGYLAKHGSYRFEDCYDKFPVLISQLAGDLCHAYPSLNLSVSESVIYPESGIALPQTTIPKMDQILMAACGFPVSAYKLAKIHRMGRARVEHDLTPDEVDNHAKLLRNTALKALKTVYQSPAYERVLVRPNYSANVGANGQLGA